MPLSATVTPLSLYMLDNSVFDGLQLPVMPTNPTDYPDLYVSGFQLDRDVLINNILLETGELNVIYPDPVFFKFAVEQWSKKELHVWQALYDTLFYNYNPLWNKDGTIKETARDLTSKETTGSRSTTEETTDTIRETDTHNLQDQRTANLRTVIADTTQNTGTQTFDTDGTAQEARDGDVHTVVSGTTANTGTVTDAGTTGTENKVSAYNDNAYQNRDKTDTTTGNTRTDNLSESRSDTTQVDDNSVIDHTTSEDTTRTDNLFENYDSDKSETGTDTIAHTGTLGRTGDNEKSTEGSEETSGTEEGSLDHTLTRTETGNIGVTMTTALIQAQRDLVKLNFYDLIIDSFKSRFCLLVY